MWGELEMGGKQNKKVHTKVQQKICRGTKIKDPLSRKITNNTN